MPDKSVHARSTAIAAGAVVAFYVVTLFVIRQVPDRVVALFGGPNGGVDRYGGLRMQYRPPPGVDLEVLRRGLSRRSEVARDGDTLILELPGAAEDQAEELRVILAGGSLQMKGTLETEYAVQIAAADDSIIQPRGREPETDQEPADDRPTADRALVGDQVKLSTDYWRIEQGEAHYNFFLESRSREALERVTAGKGFEIGYELIEPWSTRDRAGYWRTYELAPEVIIDGSMIESARGELDAYTNRPIVALEFTPEGAERFCEASRRLTGHKLATILGGRIRSAPIINNAICGGRVTITMGGSDAQKQLRERDALVAVLSRGALPAGGVVEHSEWHSAPNIDTYEWAGRLLLGLVAGALFALLVGLVIRFTQPRWRAAPPHEAPGRFPLRRLVVTLLAPLALVGLAKLTVPGINDYELMHVTRSSTNYASVIALGLVPIITAYVLVELVALAIPPLRKLRHTPLGRTWLGKATALVSIVLALLQGYFVAVYFEALSRGGADVVDRPGLKFRLLVMISLATGTLLLGIVAGIIRERGLGNGYGALMISGWVLSLVDGPFNGVFAFGLIALCAIATLTVGVLRWRIGGEREVQLRVPSSGLTPLNDAVGIVVVFIVAIGLGDVLGRAVDAVAKLHGGVVFMLGLAVVLVPVWSWIFARPKLVAHVALRAGLAPPSMLAWARATAVSAVFVVAAGALGLVAIANGAHIADPILAMIAAAVVLDVIDDAGAHSRRVEPAWVLHQVQYAGVVERTLIDAGIPCHLHASHLRTLLAFFGPFAPVIVLVPVDLAAEARIKIGALFG